MTTEEITWRSPDDQLPDADMTLLLEYEVRDGDSTYTVVESGWYDGEEWRLCESGGQCAWPAITWAELPKGTRG